MRAGRRWDGEIELISAGGQAYQIAASRLGYELSVSESEGHYEGLIGIYPSALGAYRMAKGFEALEKKGY